jgi:hypothetical protein
MACTRRWSRCLPIAAVAPESASVDVLVAVANRPDLPALEEHLSAMSTDVGRVCRVFSSVPDCGDLLMHSAYETGTFGALHPVGLRAG